MRNHPVLSIWWILSVIILSPSNALTGSYRRRVYDIRRCFHPVGPTESHDSLPSSRRWTGKESFLEKNRSRRPTQQKELPSLYSVRQRQRQRQQQPMESKNCGTPSCNQRRQWLRHVWNRSVVLVTVASPLPSRASDSSNNSNNNSSSNHNNRFTSKGASKPEYSNALTASRDTNISPREAYDVLAQSEYVATRPLRAARLRGSVPRALDLGAGAGVSTQLLVDLGYRDVDAVDWSGDAWRTFVSNNEIPSESDVDVDSTAVVHFWEMDDERFFKRQSQPQPQDQDQRTTQTKTYDAIIYNFAVNDAKARSVAASMLSDTGEAYLLAPVNVQDDYWLKQQYRVYDKSGQMVWQQVGGDVGAWSVQFQPDVTQDTCQGIWCPPFNGFKKMP